jgi:hypothetical protein
MKSSNSVVFSRVRTKPIAVWINFGLKFLTDRRAARVLTVGRDLQPSYNIRIPELQAPDGKRLMGRAETGPKPQILPFN